MRRVLLGLIVAGIATSVAAAPAAEKPVEVMVLGSFHFDNPGRDIANVQADDVLQPSYQRELDAIAAAIASWRPTKVMVERVAPAPDLIDPKYPAFTPADLGKNRDERVQLGYRIAARLRMPTVYAIDEQGKEGGPDYFPFQPVMDYASTHGKAAFVAQLTDAAKAYTAQVGRVQREKGVAAALLLNNDQKGFGGRIGDHYRLLAVGDSQAQPAADLNAMWYLRNAKIFGKLMSVAEPGDRVLVVYGSGHGYWLRHFSAETPGYRNVEVAPFLARVARR